MTSGRRLYHYTALHHAAEIRASGRIRGSGIPIPSDDGTTLVGIVPGWQWLTTDDTWQQAWATQELIRCDRTECRFVVEIPLLELDRLHRWDAVARDFGYRPAMARAFAAIGGGSDASSWYVFDGVIPLAWLVGLERRPATGTRSILSPSVRRRRTTARKGRR